jgi:hypothetical protein
VTEIEEKPKVLAIIGVANVTVTARGSWDAASETSPVKPLIG